MLFFVDPLSLKRLPCVCTFPLTSLPASPRQLLLAPPFCALSSSIFFALFLNSSYWHFSYECRSSYIPHVLVLILSTMFASSSPGSSALSYSYSTSSSTLSLNLYHPPPPKLLRQADPLPFINPPYLSINCKVRIVMHVPHTSTANNTLHIGIDSMV